MKTKYIIIIIIKGPYHIFKSDVLRSPLFSGALEGSRGLLCTRGWAYSICTRGTSDAGGL